MIRFENESNKERLERFIRLEILPQLQFLLIEQPEHFVELLIQHCKLISVSKDQYLEDSSGYEDGKFHYLYKGIARSFYFDSIFKKTIISRIWTKTDVIFDLNSFHNKEDRIESIQMLEDGEVFSINYSKLEDLLNSFPQLTLLLFFLEAKKDQYAIFYQYLLKLNVDERLRLYLFHNPGIMPRINNDYIAMYLNMNRSTLSIAYQNYKQETEEKGD